MISKFKLFIYIIVYNIIMAHVQNMFQETKLVIPDFVSPLDIDKIYKWFQDFNIAELDNIEFFEHEEPEYYVEDKRDFYGYAVIHIKEWYNNQGSHNFYQNIANLRCKMIYDDPHYWTLEFYDYSLYEDMFTKPTILYNNNIIEDTKTEKNDETQENDESQENNETQENDESQENNESQENDESQENIINNIVNKISSYFNDKKEEQQQKEKEQEEQEELEEQEQQQEEIKEENNIYQETDQESDFEKKYYYHLNKKLSKSKKNKSKDFCETDANNSDNVDNNETQDKYDNKMLKSLIKKNRENAKRKKEKALKNIWSRRLRVKLE